MNAATPLPQAEIFAVDFATLAREIAMDIFPVQDILKLHNLTDVEWARIQASPKFIEMLAQLTREWHSAANTKERVKAKASSGLEAMLEVYIRDINDPDIPLNQRVEAGKFLARLGELDQQVGVGPVGGGVRINISITPDAPPLQLDVTPTIDLAAEPSELADLLADDGEDI